MTKHTKELIPGTVEAWDNGDLGEDLEHAKLASPEDVKSINDALSLQMISIRLPKTVIEDFKTIAMVNGVGYQPLMREALMRFADCEMKAIARDYAAYVKKEKEVEVLPEPPKKRAA